jgi:hypothetical protein
MLGARPDGRPVSARTTGLMPLKVEGKRSFLRGREVFGGAIVGVVLLGICLVWLVIGERRIGREGLELGCAA